MNSPTPTSPSALADAQALPAASAAGTTTSAVLTSTAVSSGSTEKHAKKKSSSLAGIKHPAVSLKELFGEDFEEDIVDYDDVEEGELEGKTSAPVSSSEDTPDPPLGSRRPRDEVPDASSSKRPRSDEEASPMLRALTAPRTDPPVRAPWMPTEAQIHDRFGASSPPNPILLYSCNSINDDDVAKEVDFESETQRRDYYIGLFHELRYFAAKKTSRKSKVPEWQALCQSWNAFVDNFNKDPKAYRERVVATRDRFYTYTSRGKCERLHDQSMEAGIPCAVPFGTFCPCRPPGAARLSESDLTGYTLTRVPDHIKELRARLEPREAPSAVVDRSTPRAGLNPASYGGLRTPSPFPERPPSGRSAAPTYLAGEEILSNEYENEPLESSFSYEPRSAPQSSGSLHARRATAAEGAETLPPYGQRYDHDDRALHDRVAALEQSQSAEIACNGVTRTSGYTTCNSNSCDNC
ncbi:hypothetical protein P3T76_016195 [Phytophthora citrophthora]|uniref:Uncharacterized protein n=1 Tax=Phytophthora citrophthora TaxID=4793 RepID=A0AAD9FXZ3_9STRA|nr:hypothetical protein P3T76_016193 [Phytophthora citrophthora]KAK1928339.1 hypothetical protein P3T76_016195 [Phytophthora citrophthora]